MAVLAVMCVGMFLVLLDVTVVNVALPSIASGLGADSAATPWIVDAYAVAIAGLLLAGGTVGDRIGHRRVVLAGLGLFGAASAACGLATGPGMLIAARAVQGVGAALLLPGSLAVITEVFPDRAARTRALGIWAGVSSLALPAGPLLGGFLVASGGWRVVFLVNVPVVLAALVAVPRLVPAGIRRPERRGGLPLDLLRRPAFVGPNVAAGAMNLVVNGLLFVTTLFLQGVQHRGPVAAGVALLPMFLPLAFLGPVAGRLAARFGPRPLLVGGALVAAMGAAGYALFEPASGYLALLPALLGLGIGAGLFTAPVVTAAMSAVPAERSGLAGGINNTARQTGTVLGVAVFGAVAGSTATPDAFVHGVHVLAGLGAVVWLAVVVLVARTSGAPVARRES